MYIYIYIYYIFLCFLFLSIYIYIYIYNSTGLLPIGNSLSHPPRPPCPSAGGPLRKVEEMAKWREDEAERVIQEKEDKKRAEEERREMEKQKANGE